MRARKNSAERQGMQRAHIIDGAAMCDALALLERRVCLFDSFCYTISVVHHMIRIDDTNLLCFSQIHNIS